MTIYRPEEFAEEKRDCVVRALSSVLRRDYKDMHSQLKTLGRKDKHGVKFKFIEKNINNLGAKFKVIKRSGSLKKLKREYPTGRIFCLKRGHAFPLINGEYYDVNSDRVHIEKAWLLIEEQNKTEGQNSNINKLEVEK
jgi:hypothetical protein